MKNIYLVVVIVIAIAVVAGGAVIFLMNRSLKTDKVNLPPFEESTQIQEEATGTPDTPGVLRDLGSTPEALQEYYP